VRLAAFLQEHLLVEEPDVGRAPDVGDHRRQRRGLEHRPIPLESPRIEEVVEERRLGRLRNPARARTGVGEAPVVAFLGGGERRRIERGLQQDHAVL
jgi:hypothetical protein